jgi:AraC-like DNA-binding protein/ligand-binding sensor protein
MIKPNNIIHRRDLEPVWEKAVEVVQHYERAVDCATAVVGLDSFFVNHSKKPNTPLFCTLCKRYCHSTGKLGPNEYPCTAWHLESVQEARKLGGSHVYACPLGFFFWTSPFFSGERLAGALMSSGAVAVNSKQPMLDKIFDAYKREISRAEISQYLDSIPERNNENINALVQMMLLCAQRVSSTGSRWDYSAEQGGIQNCQSVILDQERLLIASLRRGDSCESLNIVRKLMDNLNVASNGNLEYFKLKVIEMVVLLSRSGVNPENNEPIEINYRYLNRISDSKSVEEVNENMYVILDQLAVKIFSFQGVRHASALRKAERFIWENYTRKISLKEIAGTSGLSAPYFSTIFKDEMGENLFNYLNRLRVEKASSMLKETGSSISDISAACGFKDQSWFSKIFKSHTGFSPCKYREHGGIIMEGQSQMKGQG